MTLTKQDYCSVCQEHGVCRGYFGLCPVCHKTDGSLNVGRSHWFYCKEHKKCWCAGSNVFSSWRDQTEQEQRQRYAEIGFDNYDEIDCAYIPPDCVAFRQSSGEVAMLATGQDDVPF